MLLLTESFSKPTMPNRQTHVRVRTHTRTLAPTHAAPKGFHFQIFQIFSDLCLSRVSSQATCLIYFIALTKL